MTIQTAQQYWTERRTANRKIMIAIVNNTNFAGGRIFAAKDTDVTFLMNQLVLSYPFELTFIYE